MLSIEESRLTLIQNSFFNTGQSFELAINNQVDEDLSCSFLMSTVMSKMRCIGSNISVGLCIEHYSYRSVSYYFQAEL